MKELHPVEPEAPPVFLVGIRDAAVSKAEAEALGAELEGLAETLGLAVTGSETVHIRERNLRYGMGSGKARELADRALQAGAECIVFDRELTPSQQRNWEDLSGISAMDRQELIIRIFASRARTREAVLQAELAERLYALPRLSHRYISLARQRGGSYAARGSGETRLETDRRFLRQRIGILKGELETLGRQRQVQRRRRERQGTPVCALVGYTNAGKSSLHRVLTGSSVAVEDKLFATLDPTARRVSRPDKDGGPRNLIMVDTVGFIRRLPHNLVDAFHSTLEESARANILIHVLDASDPARDVQAKTVMEVLGDLGADKIPLITALNKTDLLGPAETAALLEAYPGSTAVSAITRMGIDRLWNLIEKKLKL
ncbi:MAG: GTPase HflX [Spirochaetaceae bacterium]|jgi:GTP-binding protein HflX|nr:GTPase HflX [Spirochaetaceae bacterium]